MRVERLAANPILTPESHPSLGSNLNGPSLIRAPEWLDRGLGAYWLYFAHHKGDRIRLAHAERIEGPWRVHAPGALHLEDSRFPTDAAEIRPTNEIVRRLLEAGLERPHVASPDVHVDDERRELRMYFHGLMPDGSQRTRAATSPDGLRFEARDEILGVSYFRAFRYRGAHYALGMPGVFYRSDDGLSGFERGPALFAPDVRHSALLLRGDVLHVFWTRVGDAPERILRSTVALGPDWGAWRASEPIEVLRPERDWEGASLPCEPSIRGAALKPVNQLRDPAIHEEDGRVWLLYSVAGESGIAIARLEL